MKEQARSIENRAEQRTCVEHRTGRMAQQGLAFEQTTGVLYNATQQATMNNNTTKDTRYLLGQCDKNTRNGAHLLQQRLSAPDLAFVAQFCAEAGWEKRKKD